MPPLLARRLPDLPDKGIPNSRALVSALQSATRRAIATIPHAIEHVSSVAKRQTIGLIPTAYQVKGPSPGTIVGIVLGSVAGFLLVAMLIYSATGGNLFAGGGGRGSAPGIATGAAGVAITGEEFIVRRGTGSQGRSARRSRNSRSDREIREIREISKSPRRTSRTIVEERRMRPAQRRGSFLTEERVMSRAPPSVRRVDDDDVVEVIEEHSVSTSPPRNYRSKRSNGGYRQVDPTLYAGGNYPQRIIRRSDDED